MSEDELREHAKSCGHCSRHALPWLDEIARLRGVLAATHAEAVRQIAGTADDVVTAGEKALKKLADDLNERLVLPLIAERDHLSETVSRIEALAEKWQSAPQLSDGKPSIVMQAFAAELRAALEPQAVSS